MNETIMTILKRRSVRKYKTTPVKDEDIELILECAKYAPTGMGLQPWHFTVVTDRALLDEISEKNKRTFLTSTDEQRRKLAKDPDFDSFRGAPMAIIASGRNDAIHAKVDCANAIENMALAAESLGLSSCYLASFKVAMDTPAGAGLLKKLDIPSGYTPVLAIAIGYGDEELEQRAPRRENTVNYIR